MYCWTGAAEAECHPDAGEGLARSGPTADYVDGPNLDPENDSADYTDYADGPESEPET